MPTFAYRARDSHGALMTGQMEAEAEKNLVNVLAEKGLIPIHVKKVVSWIRLPSLEGLFRRRVKLDELLVFTRQFQTLFKAGLGMDSILSALIRQCQNKTLREVLQAIRTDVSSGGTLAKAFSRHPRVFRDFYIHMLAAGEEAGILDQSLGHLCDLLEKEDQIHASVKSATLYPKIVVFVLFLATTLLMILVVPKFVAFYANFDIALPLPTLILMRTSHFFVHDWPVLLILLAGFLYAYRSIKKTARGQLKLGEIAFRMPVFGPLNLRVCNSRFCHILSALYRSGLPITRSLEITVGTMENGAFRRDIELLRSEVTKGRSFSDGMKQCRFFTPVVVEAVSAGEKSGALDEMMESIGRHYDLEVSHIVKNLTTLLEPLLLVLVFGMVGLFALAIFLPIWNLSQIAGH